MNGSSADTLNINGKSIVPTDTVADDTAVSLSDDNIRANRKKRIIKAAVMIVLLLAMLIFATMHMITKQMTAETA